MSEYWILADRITGELLQVSTDKLDPAEGQIVKCRSGIIPDPNKFVWRNSCLAFFPIDQSRVMTRLAFMRRLTNEELAAVYGAAKQNPLLEVWLDKFKLAEEISLDDEEIVTGLHQLEAIGLLASGRAAEILA